MAMYWPRMSDIFHPNANSHRAHCQYVMKLYKSVTTDNIEDPILEKFKDEYESEKKAAYDLSQKALNYSKQFESAAQELEETENTVGEEENVNQMSKLPDHKAVSTTKVTKKKKHKMVQNKFGQDRIWSDSKLTKI